MSWLFPGEEVRIDAPCLDCGQGITLRMKDDQLLEAQPETMVGHIALPVRQWADVSNAYL